MTRILISFLGTGLLKEKAGSSREYKTSTYTFEGREIGTSAFVSSVLYDFLQIDKIILIGTVKSMWEEAYRYFSEKNGRKLDEDYYFELANQLESADHATPVNSLNLGPLQAVLGTGSRAKVIPYGLNEQEHWDIFNLLAELFKELEEQDKVHLDVTHAFRSLPMFSMTAFMYLTDVIGSHISMEGIYYGMLETNREFEGKTPIVDLSLIVKIQQWIKGAYAFTNFGKGYLLSELLENEHQARTLRQFSDALSLNTLGDIQSQLHQFRALSKSKYAPIASFILPPILLDFTNRLLAAESQAQFQLELSIWHREKRNYASAYIVFVESLITYVCEQEGWNWQDLNDRNKAKTRLKDYAKYKKLQPIYKKTNSVRNNIAHNLKGTLQEERANVDELADFQCSFKNYVG